jgi:Uma2 family endonuclease
LQQLKQPGYAELPPVVVCEVLDSDERWLDVMEKGLEYLHIGTRVVCLVDPQNATAVMLRDHKPPQLLHAKDDFTLPEVLPNLRVPVGQFFA